LLFCKIDLLCSLAYVLFPLSKQKKGRKIV
jgi:hypothetical protein